MMRQGLLTLCSSLLLLSPVAQASIATYEITVNNDWTQADYPINYPSDAHFSWLGGGTHSGNVSFWGLGQTASAGFEKMAETGVTTDFVNEIAAVGTGLEWRHWFCQPGATNSNCGSLTEQFTIDSSQPFLTLTSMLGPSPDWVVGVSGLDLFQGGSWISSINTPLALYDGGTEDGTTPTMDNAGTSPFDPISLIAYDSNTGNYLPTNTPMIVGSFDFRLVDVTPVPVPAAFWMLLSGF
ncbi:MAG: spondin domain-containing protein, partial [bacterium]